MELDLTPKLPKKVIGGDGGSQYKWSPDELPTLRLGNIGAAKLSLQKNGFALPHYADSSKVTYVLQGIYNIYLRYASVEVEKGDEGSGRGGVAGGRTDETVEISSENSGPMMSRSDDDFEGEVDPNDDDCDDKNEKKKRKKYQTYKRTSRSEKWKRIN